MSQSMPKKRQTLYAALNQLEISLQLLDDGGAPADIAAHVDLAVHRLRAALKGLDDAGEARSITNPIVHFHRADVGTPHALRRYS
jgi:hypothetical protein